MNGFTVKFEFVNELEGTAQTVRTEGGWVVQVNQWKFDAFDDDTQRFILLHEFQHVLYAWETAGSKS